MPYIPDIKIFDGRYTYLYTNSTEFYELNGKVILKQHHYHDENGGLHVKSEYLYIPDTA